jgi:hypothetical protein
MKTYTSTRVELKAAIKLAAGYDADKSAGDASESAEVKTARATF